MTTFNVWVNKEILTSAIVRLHVGDLHAFDGGECPWALVSKQNTLGLELGVLKQSFKTGIKPQKIAQDF